MAVPLPNLDDRRWADLVEEGRAMIPLHAPEWTDHNIHDPGITLIELMAWLAEMQIYHVNRIPDRHKLKFLALVGIEPRPPRAARAVLRFALTPAATEPLLLPTGTEFSGQDAFGDETFFRTLDPIKICRAIISGLSVTTKVERQDLTEKWKRGAALELFGPSPRRGDILAIEFDQPLPSGHFVNLFFTLADQNADEEERTRLIQEAQQREAICDRRHRSECCREAPTDPTPPPLPTAVRHHSVRLAWEYYGTQAGRTGWFRLSPERGELDDDTRALTLNGCVRIAVPGPMAPIAQLPSGQAGRRRYSVRCRLEGGSYDAAPVAVNVAINGVMAEQAVPAGDGIVIENETIETVLLGVGDGRPWQKFALPQAPVQVESFRLFLKHQAHWEEWQRRRDFDASRRQDAHYHLEPSAGTVTFGDGEHGRVPPRGVPLYASYRATRAQAGNLAPNSIRALPDSKHNRSLFGSKAQLDNVRNDLALIGNPLAAHGGLAAESLAGAEARAVALLESPQRAVTLADYEWLARATPGVRLARVEARPNLHPSFPCLKATGVNTLMVLPYLPAGRPMPSAGLLQAVAAYVSRRRVIGTRVEVVAPAYLEVAVQAKVRARSSMDKQRVQQTILEALNRFLHPLWGGPEGTGWPFGRDVYRSEILQVIDQVAGVEHVLALDLLADNGTPQCGNVCLAPTWLVAAGKHRLEIV